MRERAMQLAIDTRAAPYLSRYLTRDYVPIPDAFGVEKRDTALYFTRLDRLLRSEEVAYLVVSRAELRERPRSLLGFAGEAVPPWLVLVQRDRDAALWKIVDPARVTTP
jgi:hypothetical protein